MQAEALVWRYGEAGVEVARERLRLSVDAPAAKYAIAWLVCRMAEDRQALLATADTASRYDVGTAWASRPGQLIRSDK